MTTETDKLVEMARALGAQPTHLETIKGALGLRATRLELTAEQLAAFASAHIASLCGDVEPVAWGIFANNGNIRFWACDKASADSQAAKTGGDVEGIFRASTVAALKARVAELEKDAARLEFVCNSPNRMVERENGLWRVYEDVAPTDRPTAVWQGITPRWHVTPREAIDAAITAALTKGQP